MRHHRSWLPLGLCIAAAVCWHGCTGIKVQPSASPATSPAPAAQTVTIGFYVTFPKSPAPECLALLEKYNGQRVAVRDSSAVVYRFDNDPDSEGMKRAIAVATMNGGAIVRQP